MSKGLLFIFISVIVLLASLSVAQAKMFINVQAAL